MGEQRAMSPSRLLRGALVALPTILVLAVVPARAHEERALGWLTVVDRVQPEVPGLDVGIAHVTAPAVVVRNRTGDELVVFGADGERFLRIGPRGTFANVRSPTIYRSVDPQGGGTVPRRADAEAPPRWVLMTEASEWSWFDPRVHQEEDAPAGSRWAIDARLGDRAISIAGGFEALADHGHFRSLLDEVPTRDDLTIELVEGPVPAIFVNNETGETLLVPGRAGEPFLRIGPAGVDANLRSPSYYLGGAQVIKEVPRTADTDAPPRWKRVSAQPVWAWLEYRASAPGFGLSRVGLDDARRVVAEWSLPLELAGETLTLAGRTEWIPARTTAPEAGPPDRTWVVAVTFLAGAGALLVALRGWATSSERGR
ncbi:MAG TPA: hypothetical protein VFS18_00550 [Actinomycetota bacterium]|nr:hypothetical protein [Actinomycetota bacterium]